MILVFEDGTWGSAGAVDQDESHFPVLQVQPLDDLRDGAGLGNIEGDRFCSFREALQSADGSDMNNHGRCLKLTK